MRSELSDVLERGAERPTAEPDFADLARKGRRRRYAQRTSQGLAVVAVIALTAGVVLPRLRPPEVMFDSGPRGGVGTWEAVPPAPIETRVDALSTTDGRRVVVFGGTATNDPNGDVPLYDGAVYDTKSQIWTPIEPLDVGGELPKDHWFADHMELLEDGRLLVVFEARGMVAFYDFAARTWEQHSGEPEDVPLEFAAWTGSQAIFFGPAPSGKTVTSVYTDDVGWETADGPALSGRLFAATAWTGERLLVWGGMDFRALNDGRERVLDDGAAFDPVTRKWDPLPESPLSARQSAESLWTGDEWILMGGFGAARAVPEASEATKPQVRVTEEGGVSTGSGTVGAEASTERVDDGETFVDGARYNPSTQTWTPVAMPPKGAREHVSLRDETFEAQGDEVWARYDAEENEWVRHAELPNPYDFDATVAVGGRTIQVNTTRDTHMVSTDRPRRIAGQVYNERAQRWDPLAEAETPQRWGAAVTPVGDDRYFVWGGVSVTRDISGHFDGDPAAWKYHDDGAILTLD